MNAPLKGLIAAGIVGLCFVGCGKKAPPGSASPPVPRPFVVEKRAQAKELAGGDKVPAEVWQFFDAVERDDGAVSNLFNRLSALHRKGTVLRRSAAWAPIHETYGIYEQFHEWKSPWLARFGQDIIKSIPEGSIYFGGTDPGRFLITAMSESHRNGRPFFTLTQNALADSTYLDYLQEMYGTKIQIPSPDDSQKAFQDYLADAQQRMRDGKLKPGEDVKVTDGRIQVSGQVAVMEINGRLVKVISDKNPDREFFVEESFPLDWMYPYLEPHDLILKLNHAPLAGLSDEVVRRDHEFWSGYAKEMIGDWLTDDTPVKAVCDFAAKVYGKKDLSGYNGDVGFAQDQAAQKSFSKLRSAIAGVYAWRADNSKDPDEKARMQKEADLAFRQAFALCPYSPEAVFRYINLLQAQNRRSDALLVAQTCLDLDPKNGQVRDLVTRLQSMR